MLSSPAVFKIAKEIPSIWARVQLECAPALIASSAFLGTILLFRCLTSNRLESQEISGKAIEQIFPKSGAAASLEASQPLANVEKINDKALKVVGLSNPGANNCFMNAAFQLIMNNRPLLAALKKTYSEKIEAGTGDIATYEAFLSFIKEYEEGKTVLLTSLRNLLVAEGREIGSFGDSSEFLSSLLQLVDPEKHPEIYFHRSTIRSYQHLEELTSEQNEKLEGAKIIDGTRTREQIEKERTILSSEGKAEKIEPVHSLIIPLDPPKKITSRIFGISLLEYQEVKPSLDGTKLIQENLRLEEAVEAAEPVICEQDLTLNFFNRISEKKEIQTFPERLTVQLGRFYYTPENPSTKINTIVNMPMEFTTPDGLFRYSLRSVIFHEGAHYWSYIRRGEHDPWKVVNDSVVTSAKHGDLEYALSKGYIYDYERINNQL
jgi:ubiquitin C-terminal hydrolase